MPLQQGGNIQIQEELERRILHGLSCEWDAAFWGLRAADREGFRKPLFSLQDMEGRWGYWSREKREICLSRKLVLHHSWDSVREVLLHEAAHQFSDEVLGTHNEPPHGPGFRRACLLLRANPKASGHGRPLDERVFHNNGDPNDRMMVRVRKLMALAQSKNRHEAEAAMAKAHAFIKKYNVDLLARNEDRDFASVFVGKPLLRHFRESYYISNLLQDFYFVFGIWVPAYVLDKAKMGSVLEISGTVQHVRIASYVHDFVERFVDSQWRVFNQDKGLNRYRKTDFAVGIMEGFRSKLKAGTKKKKAREGKRALVTLKDQQLQEYVAYRYPRTTMVKGRALKRDKKVWNAGISLGKELVISKGIEGKGKGKRALIGKGS
ncbi:MAG: SprT family zinc-dependent metalloprotease [Deltaproteobacteria bacterium]|nr:SprT family zinc-dependent metalloprotease [Deltaproteobacteria bacterium]